jgi:hypothetical protein
VETTALDGLTALLDTVLLADLPEAAGTVMAQVQSCAALTSDVAKLIDALVPLVTILRYGSVRESDTRMVGGIVGGLIARICVGLPLACGSLGDDAAEEMYGRLGSFHDSLALLKNEEHLETWEEVLLRLTDAPNLHGLVGGRIVRLLLEGRWAEPEEAARRMSLALSAAADPMAAARWIEGFLRGSGLVLIHDDTLWNVVDEWLCDLTGEAFTHVLPLVRRTFSSFAPAERRQMGERVRRGAPKAGASGQPRAGDDPLFDHTRAERVLPVVCQLLGLGVFDIGTPGPGASAAGTEDPGTSARGVDS